MSFHHRPLSNISLSDLIAATHRSLNIHNSHLTATVIRLAPRTLTHRRIRARTGLHRLCSLLVAPVTSLLPTSPARPIIFVPRSRLFLIPFTTLGTPGNRCLVRGRAVLASPSVRIFNLTARTGDDPGNNSSTAHGPLVINGPAVPDIAFLDRDNDFRSIQLSPLPNTRQRTRTVSDFLRAPTLLNNTTAGTTMRRHVTRTSIVRLTARNLLRCNSPQRAKAQSLPNTVTLTPNNESSNLLATTRVLRVSLQTSLTILDTYSAKQKHVAKSKMMKLSHTFITTKIPDVVISL